MIEITQHGDVQRLRMVTWRSRLVGYDVSAYVARGILIDTGPWHARHDLLNALRRLHVRGAIVTHWHEDHAGNVPALAAERLPLWMARETEQQLRAPFQPKFYRRFTWGASPRLSRTPAAPDIGPLQVVHMPGHSSDHHAVWDAETRTLFSADLWLGVRVRAVAATEDPYQVIESLSRAIALHPERMFDAHRGLVTDPMRALEAKRAWLQETVAAIEARLDAGDTDRAILADLLGGEEAIGWMSQGEYARRNFIETVRRGRRTGA